MAEILEESSQLESVTININRTAATVKGGRRMSFAALVVVGDRKGSIGIGYGKAPGVPAAIEKAQKDARKNLKKVFLKDGTVPHPVTGKFGSSQVRLIPAAPGSGVIAGGTVRSMLEVAGVHDCLTKAYGSTNDINVVKAVLDGLIQLRSRDEIASLRGVTIEKTTVDEMFELSRKAMEAAAAKAPVAPSKPKAPAPAPAKTEKKAEEKAEEKKEEPKAEAPAEEAKAEETPAEEAAQEEKSE